jgi:hypothetical protein
MFEKIYVKNSFPTAVGEAKTRIKQISTLKMNLINAIIGSDMKHLTTDEELKSFFKSEFDKAEADTDTLSWDAIHKENYDKALLDNNLMEGALHVPRRTRINRQGQKNDAVVVFGKKGDESIFTISEDGNEPTIVSAEQAVPYFEATKEEESFEVKDKFAPTFSKAREKLFAKHPLPAIKGRRADALKVLYAIKESVPVAEVYCSDLIKVIKEFDDISEGTLKDISQMSLSNVENLYEDLLKMVPVQFIRNVIDRARRSDNDKEFLLLAEELEA